MRFFRLLPAVLMLVLINGICVEVLGQVPTFSGFWLTPQLTAPTAMAGNEVYQLTAHYRRQALKENIGYRTLLLNGQLPVFDRSGNHFGTVGLSLMRDENGSSFLYSTSGVMLTYLYDASISFRHHLVGGVQGGYYSRKIDWSKVTTSNQFVNGSFDPSAGSGESFSDDPARSFIANVGLAYYLADYKGDPLVHVGAALKNANSGSFNYLTNSQHQPIPVAVASYAQIRLISNQYYTVVSDLFWQNRNKINEFRGGFQLRKGINPRVSIEENHLGIGLYYAQDHSATIALQLVQADWLLALSYDLAFGESPLPKVQNAVEVTLGWRAIPSNKRIKPGRYRRNLPWKNKRKLPWLGR